MAAKTGSSALGEGGDQGVGGDGSGIIKPRDVELDIGLREKKTAAAQPQHGSWTLSGWLLTPFLQSAGMETVMRMRKRVLDNLGTTFASGYKTKVDLEGMLTKDAILDYRQMKTGEKYLVTPQG